MVRQVINVRGNSEQLSPVIEIDANSKRGRFRRAIDRYTYQEFSTNFECWRPVCSTLFHTRQREPDVPHSVEINVFKDNIPAATWIGLSVIICGGMIIQFGNKV